MGLWSWLWSESQRVSSAESPSVSSQSLTHWIEEKKSQEMFDLFFCHCQHTWNQINQAETCQTCIYRFRVFSMIHDPCKNRNIFQKMFDLLFIFLANLSNQSSEHSSDHILFIQIRDLYKNHENSRNQNLSSCACGFILCLPSL